MKIERVVCLTPCTFPFVSLTFENLGLPFFFSSVFASSVLFTLSAFLLLIRRVFFSTNYWLIFGYLIFQAFHGVTRGHSIGAFMVFSSFLYMLCCFSLSRLLPIEVLVRELKYFLVFFISLLVISSEVNFLISGRLLPLLFQNLMLFSIFLSIVLSWYMRDYRIVWIVIAIAMIYMWLIDLRSPIRGMHVQVKFFLFTAASIFVVFGVKYLPILGRLFINFPYLKILFIGLVFILSYSWILDHLGAGVGRGNSAYVRGAVNSYMAERVVEVSPLFGFGLGSSGVRFPIEGSLGDVIFAVPHSWFFSFFYENGFFGVFLVLLLLGLSQRIRVVYVNGRDREFLISSRFILVSFAFLMFFLNIVIISSLPFYDPFWLYGSGALFFVFFLAQSKSQNWS